MLGHHIFFFLTIHKMDDFEVDLLAQAQKFLPVPHINHEQIAYICSLAQELGRKAIEEVQIGQLKVDILKVCAAAFESESSPQLSWFYRWKRMQLTFLSHPGGSEAVTLLCAVYFLFHLRKALSRRRPVAIEQAKVF